MGQTDRKTGRGLNVILGVLLVLSLSLLSLFALIKWTGNAVLICIGETGALPQCLSGDIGDLSRTDPQYYSVQRDTTLTIPSGEWVLVSGYTTVNSNRGGGADAIDLDPSEDELMINAPGVYQISAYLRWGNASDDYAGQRLIRFVREPDTENDTFGASEHIASAGRTFQSHSYTVGLQTGRGIALQVFQDSGEEVALEFAQFKAARVQAWD